MHKNNKVYIATSQKNPYLNEIYKADIEAAKRDLQVLEITPKHCGYLDHRTDPVFMRSFDF